MPDGTPTVNTAKSLLDPTSLYRKSRELNNDLVTSLHYFTLSVL
jgi:hypothetical protein